MVEGFTFKVTEVYAITSSLGTLGTKIGEQIYFAGGSLTIYDSALWGSYIVGSEYSLTPAGIPATV